LLTAQQQAACVNMACAGCAAGCKRRLHMLERGNKHRRGARTTLRILHYRSGIPLRRSAAARVRCAWFWDSFGTRATGGVFLATERYTNTPPCLALRVSPSPLNRSFYLSPPACCISPATAVCMHGANGLRPGRTAFLPACNRRRAMPTHGLYTAVPTTQLTATASGVYGFGRKELPT